MVPPDHHSPDNAPLILDVSEMTDDELEQLAKALVAAQDEFVRRREVRRIGGT